MIFFSFPVNQKNTPVFYFNHLCFVSAVNVHNQGITLRFAPIPWKTQSKTSLVLQSNLLLYCASHHVLLKSEHTHFQSQGFARSGLFLWWIGYGAKICQILPVQNRGLELTLYMFNGRKKLTWSSGERESYAQQYLWIVFVAFTGIMTFPCVCCCWNCH